MPASSQTSLGTDLLTTIYLSSLSRSPWQNESDLSVGILPTDMALSIRNLSVNSSAWRRNSNWRGLTSWSLRWVQQPSGHLPVNLRLELSEERSSHRLWCQDSEWSLHITPPQSSASGRISCLLRTTLEKDWQSQNDLASGAPDQLSYTQLWETFRSSQTNMDLQADAAYQAVLERSLRINTEIQRQREWEQRYLNQVGPSASTSRQDGTSTTRSPASDLARHRMLRWSSHSGT